MLHNMIILYFRLPYLYVSDSTIFLHSTLVLLFYIDVVLPLFVASLGKFRVDLMQVLIDAYDS